jgi:hypothetical protein
MPDRTELAGLRRAQAGIAKIPDGPGRRWSGRRHVHMYLTDPGHVPLSLSGWPCRLWSRVGPLQYSFWKPPSASYHLIDVDGYHREMSNAGTAGPQSERERRQATYNYLVPAIAALLGAVIGGVVSYETTRQSTSTTVRVAYTQFLLSQRVTTYTQALNDVNALETIIVKLHGPYIGPRTVTIAQRNQVDSLDSKILTDGLQVELIGSKKAAEDVGLIYNQATDVDLELEGVQKAHPFQIDKTIDTYITDSDTLLNQLQKDLQG